MYYIELTQLYISEERKCYIENYPWGRTTIIVKKDSIIYDQKLELIKGLKLLTVGFII